jgi:N utilization substance protein B
VTRAPARPRRRQAREAALQMLYQWEVGKADLDDVVATYWSSSDHPLAEEGRPFAEALVRGTVGALDRIDPIVAAHAQHWRLERMAVIDRLILRMATFELLEGEAPPKVAINEALDLARTFSTEDAVRFINGVLDAIHRDMETSGANREG